MKAHSHRLSPIPGDDPGIDLIGSLRPYIRHCGDARRPAWQIPRRRLLDHLLVCIADGTGTFTLGDDAFRVRRGDVVWIPPDTEHSMAGDPPGMSCPYVHFDLHYQAERSHWDFSIPGGMCELGELRALMDPPVEDARLRGLVGLIRCSANARVIDLVRDICTEAARGRAFGALRMSALLLEVVAELLAARHGGTDGQPEHRPLLEETERYMAVHCQEDLRMADLAGICGLSPSRFRSVFQDQFGRSPREHLRRLRIRRAQQLMIGSDLTLGAVATACGFATVHSFSRAFRAEEGVPPSAWRRYGRGSIRVEGRRVPYIGSGAGNAWTGDEVD